MEFRKFQTIFLSFYTFFPTLSNFVGGPFTSPVFSSYQSEFCSISFFLFFQDRCNFFHYYVTSQRTVVCLWPFTSKWPTEVCKWFGNSVHLRELGMNNVHMPSGTRQIMSMSNAPESCFVWEASVLASTWLIVSMNMVSTCIILKRT